ncbi:MAG: T9SS type A sorting domain-containing protein [Bacteroidetes bacterium]|nr:T9SS type A sorting domain-containing protein [Bacteroidota bacterium]
MKNFTQNLLTPAVLLLIGQLLFAQENRTIDGKFNNLSFPDWGAAETWALNPGSIGYGDGISSPAGADRPNPRFISNSLFLQNTMANDPRGLSAYNWVWGQFIDHDITLVKDYATEAFNIPVPPFDAYFDPSGAGSVEIPLKRSNYDPATGTSTSNFRKHINSISAYIDGSAVYGSDLQRAAWLRTFSGGKLRVSAGNLMPFNTTTGELGAPVDPTAPEMAMPMPFVLKYFVAGDVRANENPFLTSIHTLFVREHNRLCDELAVDHPNWTDEQFYQHARKLVGGEIEAIVYEEWLPTLGMDVPEYDGYKASVNPGIMNVFSGAAFRYGHTTINSLLVRMDNDGQYMPQGDILLRDAIFNPTATMEVGGVEPYLIGMATVVQQDFDCKVVDDLRNFLFGPPGAGGIDLASVNIQRGRERGLPDYNTVRQDFGLQPVESFDEMSSDPLMNQTLEFVYGDINKIDPWVGILAENHMPDALFGKTAMTIVGQQFMAIRDGDRFYYETDAELSSEEKEWIKQTRLSEVIRRNTPVTIVQDEIFKAQSFVSATKEAGSNDGIDFALYPNPAREMIFLRIPATHRQDAIIRVVDLQGKILLQRNALLSDGNNTLTLTLPAECTSGLYVVTVETGEMVGYQQLVKQ